MCACFIPSCSSVPHTNREEQQGKSSRNEKGVWDENIPGLTEGSRREGGKKKERGKKERKEKREIRIKGDSASVKENREGNKKVGKEERKIYINRARSKGANKVLQSTQIYRLRNQWQNQFGWTWLLALGNASDQIL